jgi:phosphatidylserine/phosphatidylglycerophosphate/cardiolipin synthase-like enzyme
LPRRAAALAFAAGVCGLASIPTAAEADVPAPAIEIVESAPIETSLDHPDLRNAADVWTEMIRGARRSLDFAHFYTSDDPADSNDAIDRLVGEIEAAAVRGVAVRFVTASSFYKTYPQIVDRLRATLGDGARTGAGPNPRGVLLIDYKKIAGGVLHAKYFIADDEEVFLGSQNFDWRALAHIQELGVRVRDAGVARALGAVFEHDWMRAMSQAGSPLESILPEIDAIAPSPIALAAGDTAWVTPCASPIGQLPHESLWDEPRLVALIDGAKTDVSVQLLTYRPVSGREYDATLDGALRRAAARGVRVRLLVADWCKRASTIPHLKSLAPLPNFGVRMMTIPQWSGGFVPYARVIHAKYMVVDGRAAWVGTSNWERDYFHESRNVGVVIESATIAARLTSFFDGNWDGEYAYDVKPEVAYEVPRIGE